MNKIIFFISLIVVLTTSGCQNSPLNANQSPRKIGMDINAQIQAMQLPADFEVPTSLPTTIEDPILLEGWIRLYNRTKTCQLWDDHTITGQQLAEYVVDHNVVITWNTDPAYGDRSFVDRGDTENVYIYSGYQKLSEMRKTRMLATLAHEMFHRTYPFNQEQDTPYEEYWAFYVGACVSGQSLTDFNFYNPLSAQSLQIWFKANYPAGYLNEFPLYPEEVAALSVPEK